MDRFTRTLHSTLSHHTSQRRLRQVYAKQHSLARGFAAIELAATHLTLAHAFEYARLSQPGDCLDPNGILSATFHTEIYPASAVDVNRAAPTLL